MASSRILSTSTALAAHLPPWMFLKIRRAMDADEAFRLIELAETTAYFSGGAAPSTGNFDTILKQMPGELQLHYRVWRLLLAARRRNEAISSYRAACRRSSCDPGVASYHACVVTSAWLHNSAASLGMNTSNWPAKGFPRHSLELRGSRATHIQHVLELPQPSVPTFLPDHGRRYYA